MLEKFDAWYVFGLRLHVLMRELFYKTQWYYLPHVFNTHDMIIDLKFSRFDPCSCGDKLCWVVKAQSYHTFCSRFVYDSIDIGAVLKISKMSCDLNCMIIHRRALLSLTSAIHLCSLDAKEAASEIAAEWIEHFSILIPRFPLLICLNENIFTEVKMSLYCFWKRTFLHYRHRLSWTKHWSNPVVQDQPLRIPAPILAINFWVSFQIGSKACCS